MRPPREEVEEAIRALNNAAVTGVFQFRDEPVNFRKLVAEAAIRIVGEDVAPFIGFTYHRMRSQRFGETPPTFYLQWSGLDVDRGAP